MTKNHNESSGLKHKGIYAAVFIGIYLLFVLSGLNIPVYREEEFNTNLIGYFQSRYFIDNSKDIWTYYADMGIYSCVLQHPPFSMALYYLFTSVLGNTNYAFRIVPAIFGLIGLWVIYLISKMIYGEKTAIVALAISATSFGYILSSLQIDPHGAIQFTLFSLAAYFLLQSERRTSYLRIDRYFILSSIFTGFAILNVFSGIVLLLILSLYLLIKSGNIVKGVKLILFYCAIPILLVLSFFLVSYLTNFDIFVRAYLRASGILGFNFNIRLIPYLLIWIGPLLVLMPLIKMKGKNMLLMMWAYCPMVVFVLTMAQTSLDRYLPIIIPPLIILSAAVITKYAKRIGKKQVMFTSFMLLLFIFLMVVFNGHSEYVEKNAQSISPFVERVTTFNWNFFLPISGSAGPVFGVSFLSIALNLIVVFVLFAISLIAGKKRYSRWVFLALIAACFSFSIYLTTEYIFNFQHPNYISAKENLILYYKESGNNKLVITNDQSMAFHLEKTSAELFDLNNRPRADIEQAARKGNALGLLVDFPKIDRNSWQWHIFDSCRLIDKFESRGVDTAYLFECNGQS